MRPLDNYIKQQLEQHVTKIEDLLGADVLTVISPIMPGLENTVRDAVEKLAPRKAALAIILDTQGGIVEVVERMVQTVRQHYGEVLFIIPNRAMSAGTVFVMSGDRILMDYFSCLGPIDPQIEKDGRLPPALSYLSQFERLNAKAAQGTLTSAEYALLTKMDLGELFQFEQARELSTELLIKWLSNYKFKNWQTTASNGTPVTAAMKESRARQIAEMLNRNDRWHSHGRALNMQTLVGELNLVIEDYSQMGELGPTVREHFDLIQDFMNREKFPSFVHTKTFF